MKSEKNWNPGHAINKGYPYNNIPSIEMFLNRPTIGVNKENKPFIDWDPEIFKDGPDPKDWGEKETGSPFISFLLNRLVDFSESLKIAEDQIRALLEESPFIPEHFGFEIVHKHEDISDPPVRIYISKYNTSISLYRKPGEAKDINWNPSLWVLVRKTEDGKFKEDEVHIHCHRIAYAMFCALQIQVEEEKMIEIEEPKNELPELSDNTASIPQGFKVFRAQYNEGPTVKHAEGRKLTIENVVAEDKPNAISRAKFLFETNPEFGVCDLNFEDIIVTEKE